MDNKFEPPMIFREKYVSGRLSSAKLQMSKVSKKLSALKKELTSLKNKKAELEKKKKGATKANKGKTRAKLLRTKRDMARWTTSLKKHKQDQSVWEARSEAIEKGKNKRAASKLRRNRVELFTQVGTYKTFSGQSVPVYVYRRHSRYLRFSTYDDELDYDDYDDYDDEDDDVYDRPLLPELKVARVTIPDMVVVPMPRFQRQFTDGKNAPTGRDLFLSFYSKWRGANTQLYSVPSMVDYSDTHWCMVKRIQQIRDETLEQHAKRQVDQWFEAVDNQFGYVPRLQYITDIYGNNKTAIEAMKRTGVMCKQGRGTLDAEVQRYCSAREMSIEKIKELD